MQGPHSRLSPGFWGLGKRPKAIAAYVHAPLGGLAIAIAACSANVDSPARPPAAPPAEQLTEAPPARVTLSIVGTNDIHGAVQRLPRLAGYLSNLRASLSKPAGFRQPGGVVLVDAGDVFQGSLESNLGEGDVMIEVMNQLGFHAAAVGNHEFDFGPLGDPHADGPTKPAGPLTTHPQGALRARIKQARFPFLAANMRSRGGEKLPAWENLKPSVLVEVSGVKVGIVGLATPDTVHIVLPAFVEGLEFSDPAAAANAEARALRAQGAAVVVVTAHIGGGCTAFVDPKDLASCDPKQEAMQVVSQLEPGLVDVFVGGHTHKAVAHEVNGVALVESYSKLQAFSRVDIELESVSAAGGSAGALAHRVVGRRIFAPQLMCTDASDSLETCTDASYAGRPLQALPAVQALIQPAIDRAKSKRELPLGLLLTGEVTRAYDKPSPLGNLFADLTLAAGRRVAAQPSELKPADLKLADLALANGGGLRAPLPAGGLTYGSLFSAMPFDNQLAFVRLSGGDLKQVFARHLAKDKGGVLSVAGLTVRAECRAGVSVVELRRQNGRVVKDAEPLWLATSDYLATGGDGLFSGIELGPDAVHITPGVLLRDAMADELRRLGKAPGGKLNPASLLTPGAPRLQGADARPLSCAK